MLRRTLAIALAAIAAVYLGICALLYLSQRAFIYYPTTRHADVPAFVLHQQDADVMVATNGVESNRAVLYFGGNAEDVSQAIAPLTRAFPGRAVYAMYYRSYGGSTGEPSECALVADGKRLLAWASDGRNDVTVIGRSLGSGIAIQVAASARIERLVLVTPYDSIAELAARHFRIFPVKLLLRDRYESWRYAPLIRVQTTIIVAGGDQVIPNESSLRLAGRFPDGTVDVIRFSGAGHDDVSAMNGYAEALAGSRK